MGQTQLQLNSPRGSHFGQNVSLVRSRTVGFALSALASVGGVFACSGVGPRGQPVVFGDQTNIVIWDAAHQTEHFIRNASFRSGATDFGFIAPTPTTPQLNKASNQAFYTLAALAPVVTYRAYGGAGRMEDRLKSAQVQVLQEADVAGYHATTLKCPDAQAINDWMNAHGYVSTPEVEKWAERYCTRGWCLTAFKVIDKSKLIASTGTVRMSFRTDKPYNPFYVPKTNIPISGGGTLRVYFVSVGDYDAHIGRGEEPWQTPQWTSQIPEASAALLAKQVELPFYAVPDNCQVETFVDNNFPRPADDDIYFVKRKVAQLPKNPSGAPRGQVPATAALSVLASFGLFSFVRRRQGTA
jgi:hypothetical protein